MDLPHSSKSLLGETVCDFVLFSSQTALKKIFAEKSFASLNAGKQHEKISALLYEYISLSKMPCFLLPAVLKFIDEVNAHQIIEPYTFTHFEIWLNQSSGLTTAENYAARGKIMGKYLSRFEYQKLFPVGMGKTYPGSHYVTAHGSPDLDTTVASFWGWVDAFAAKVAEHLHFWNLPGGAPTSSVEVGFLFQKMFSPHIFETLVKTKTTLSVASLDLMDQKGLLRQTLDISTRQLDHEGSHPAIVLVDSQGGYLGDWRGADVEKVRRVIVLLNECLLFFAGHFHIELIALFSQKDLKKEALSEWISKSLELKIRSALPLCEFTAKQKRQLEQYLVKVLGVEEGLEASFKSLGLALSRESASEFQVFIELLEKMPTLSLFDQSGRLSEVRSEVFSHLQEVVSTLEKAIQSVRLYVDRLDIAFKIKTEVFGYKSVNINYRAEVDEIRSLMGDHSYLTVTSTNRKGESEPLGILHARDLHRPILGTVTLRDFCNREETKIPSYLEVISVIDHHKSHLQTFNAPLVYIADAQSSNVMCAELAFNINDRYSLGGMTEASIKKQIQSLEGSHHPSDQRRLQRLLKRALAAQKKGEYFIDPAREYTEYLHFLYAILDDTDLLTKVTSRDVECLASLLNRLKSLSCKEEVEVVSLDDLERDEHFPKKAADTLLKNPDLYSLYSQVYLAKEVRVEESLHLSKESSPSSFFLDVKVQNKCARVGQTKLFGRNIPSFENVESLLQTQWAGEAIHFWKEHPEIDLHMHMISTVSGAEELFTGCQDAYVHQDALWIWIPFSDVAVEHLKHFLSALKNSPYLKNNALSAEFYGEKAQEYAALFQESFITPLETTIKTQRVPSLAILRYKPGSLNSRKAAIAPYLPMI